MAPKVVFVLGPPGSGKGTQCKNIVDKYGYVHLSAGDLLRDERANPGSQYGELIENYITEGKIVPVEITCSLLERAMNKSNKDKFLIDGFPRNQNNLDGWNKEVGSKVDVQFILFFDCPLEICKERCLGRGEAGSGRSDDNINSLLKRFKTYENETKPVVDLYVSEGMVKVVDSSVPPNEVFDKVVTLFENLNE